MHTNYIPAFFALLCSYSINTPAFFTNTLTDTIASWLPLSLIAREEEQSSHEIPLSAQGTVSVSLERGNVTVETWNKEQVMLQIVKHARSAQELTALTIQIESADESCTIKATQPERFTAIDITIMVPRTIATHICIQYEGNILISQATRVNNLYTAQGIITIHALQSCAIQARAEVGTIEAICELWNASSALLLTAPRGSVSLSLPEHTAARLDISSVKYPIHCALPITFDTVTMPLTPAAWDTLMKNITGVLGTEETAAPITIYAYKKITIQDIQH